jgi:phenylacetic acid degradation protein
MPVYQFKDRIPEIDPTAWIFPNAIIIGKVHIGKNVYVGAGAVIRGDYGEIFIDEGTSVEENVTIHARPQDKTVIGKHVTLGHGCIIHNTNLNDSCVIGMGAIVSDYSDVGEYAIVGEGAVVKSKTIIPPRMIAVGVPAKVKMEVPKQTTAFWVEINKIYMQLAKDYKTELKQIDGY